MSTSLQTVRAKIAVDSKIGWRGSRTAKLSWIRNGDEWFMVEVWFEDENPKMQIRSSAHDLEEAAVIAQAVHMAIDWATNEIAAGGNKVQR